MSDSQVDSLSKVEFPQASPDSPLKGQNALVTGASYGIGAHLAAQGVNIAITARSKDKLERLATELHRRYGVIVAVIPADLMKARDRDSILPAATHALGELDILVNNAGVLRGGPLHLRDKRDISRMFVTNCIAGTELTHDILPGMLWRRSGHIITIASIAGIASLPYMAVYAATKAANVLFNLTLQTELQNTGVSSVPTRFDEGVLDATPCRLLSISARQTKKDCQRSWVQLGSKTAQTAGKTTVWQTPESKTSQQHFQTRARRMRASGQE
jgi:uncharacterized protein